jgi:hypothetical protein
MSGGAWGQEADSPTSRTFGTSAIVSHTLQAFAFGGFSAVSYTQFTSNGSGSRSCTSSCYYETALFLPAGALLVAVELEACDTNPNANAFMSLFRVGKLENPPADQPLTTASTSGTPGCTTVTGNLTPPHPIDNDAGTYFVEVFINGTDETTRFQAVRALYRLQVSPAPAVASFGDVPTGHQFFPFIEALVAAGITAGCAPGLYCVNSPITRGEMAVFLSKALGLHFAP